MARQPWHELIAASGRDVLRRRGLWRRDQSAESLCVRLLSQRGEATGLALAEALVQSIGRMSDAEVSAFLAMLSARFSPDPARLDDAITSWGQRHDLDALLALERAVEPPRQELFRRLNAAPGGTSAIVALRARLLACLPRHPALRGVDADLRHLLGSWFNRGFLRLEAIGWQSPAVVLERLIAHEAVHEIRGWDDLRQRLAADRRCFAFFHPALPDEPLIFVEVALTRGLADRIAPLIDPGRSLTQASAADTAIFYSISNCQEGLRGISFGNFLIKQVVAELSAELPRLRTFATLSPVPGLAAAVERRDDEGFTEARLRALGESPGRLALAYLMKVRRKGRADDPVAHFHLANGARLERVNVGADPSTNGDQSLSVMVNYLYEPDQLELNHERYVDSGHVALARGLASDARRVEAAWRVR